jgi:hypothetical protein
MLFFNSVILYSVIDNLFYYWTKPYLLDLQGLRSTQKITLYLYLQLFKTYFTTKP